MTSLPPTIPLLTVLTPFLFATSAHAVEFEKDIRPILAERCHDCHGPDKQKAALRLDRRSVMLRGGDSGLPTIVPGQPEKSYLLEVLRTEDSDLRMPAKGDPLSTEEVALIEKWIAAGADWPGQMDDKAAAMEGADHWAFQPVSRPDVPPGADEPVEAFLLAAMKDAGVEPNERADARTLVRRASIVLTGLPPTPERVARFEEDFARDADKAYTALVDELLASPHFGERWAQHWLDVIRWAETNGSEANLYRKNAWVYRDYVVRAFNDDLPYNRFLREQIAGDATGAGEATGFLVAGPHVPAATVGREPSAIRQARADRMDEIMTTVGASMMGITMGCARCHNHKFDPVSIQDYYAMTAIFQDIEFGSRRPELAPDHPRRQRAESLWRELAGQRKQVREFGAWEENWGAWREWHFQPITTKAIRVRFKTPNVTLDELEVFGPDDPRRDLARARHGTVVSGFPAKGVETRNPIERVIDGQFGTMTWRAQVPKNEKERPWVRLDFKDPVAISRLRMSSNREYFFDTDYLEKKPYLPRYEFDLDVMQEDGSWQPWTGTWFVNKELPRKHPKRKAVLAEIQRLIAALDQEGPRPSFVGRLVKPAPTRVLHRGSPENPRDPVMPAAPTILAGELGLDESATGRERRQRFGDWIADPDNPLTARVMANRIWHHLFGSGLVPTTSDFGNAGAAPSHPELLDWLAAEFVEPTRGETPPWSMKSLIRMLVLTDAFRRASAPTTDGMRVDASSTLLWRYPPQRVEAEVIRDGILQASGKLDPTIGGKSYRIHNVKKTYAQWQVVDNHGPHTWRRMLYQERMRRVDDRIFTAFDFPDCGQIRAKRPVSTTPLQALNLMNSPFVVDQAAFIAERAEKDSTEGGPDAAIRRCFQLLLARDPVDAELTACREVVREAGLAMVCRSLINSNEFAFLP